MVVDQGPLAVQSSAQRMFCKPILTRWSCLQLDYCHQCRLKYRYKTCRMQKKVNCNRQNLERTYVKEMGTWCMQVIWKVLLIWRQHLDTTFRLVFLDLYHNRLDQIGGLEPLTNLRVLMLGKNRIRRIEGLQKCNRLSVLDLHGNRITQVTRYIIFLVVKE